MNLQRLVASKIAMLSSKNTEIMAWEARIKESDKLFLDLTSMGMETGHMMRITYISSLYTYQNYIYTDI